MAIDPEEIALSWEQQKLLAELADRCGQSWADVLSAAIDAYQQQHPLVIGSGGNSFYDKMHEVIGIATGAPSDLSTNPKHLEGLGRDHREGVD